MDLISAYFSRRLRSISGELRDRTVTFRSNELKVRGRRIRSFIGNQN